MPETREERRAREKEEQKAKARVCISALDAMPAAMTAATGEEWREVKRDDSDSGWYDGPGDPRNVRSATLERADGFRIRFWAEYEFTKLGAYVAWPEAADGSSRRYSDTPGVPYGTKSPVARFNVDRVPLAAAKQVARVLVTDAHLAAFRWCAEQTAKERDHNAQAADWREAVAAASGIECRILDGQRVHWSNYGAWANVESSFHRPGGKLEIPLPADPAQAAALVRAVRDLVKPA